MANELQGKRVAFLVSMEGIEQVELTQPWEAVERAGGTPELIAPESGKAQAFNHLEPADSFAVDKTTAEVNAGDFDGLVIPGGVANGDKLRMDSDAVAFTRAFFDAGKTVAVICHGPWILTETDVLQGRRMTSYPSLQTDLRNAGATWVDEQVVVDDGLVTSRNPGDLDAFCAKLVEAIAAA